MCTVGKAKALGLISEDKPDAGNDGNRYGNTGVEQKPDPIARAVSMQIREISGVEDDAIDDGLSKGDDGIDTSSSSPEVSPTTRLAINTTQTANSDEAIPNAPSTPYGKPLTHHQAASLREALETPLPPAGSTATTTAASADISTATQPPSDSNPFPRLTKEALKHPQFAKAPPGHFEHPRARALRAQSSTPNLTNPAARTVQDAVRAASATPAHPQPSRLAGGPIFPRNDEVAESTGATGNTKTTKSTAATGVSDLAGSTGEEGKGKGKKDNYMA